MPLAQVHIGPGRSSNEKKLLIENVTRAISESLGPLRQPVWAMVNEVPLTDWGVDGKPIQRPGLKL